MDRGIVNTTVTHNALHGTWKYKDVSQIKVSPLITFDAFDKLKIIFRLKAQRKYHVESYFIQTKGICGDLPEQLTIAVGRDPKCPNSKVVSFKPDTSWKKINNEPANVERRNVIHFRIKLPNTDISISKSRVCNFSNFWKQSGADITIEASDGQRQNVHKTVLLARSDVFRAMWQTDMLESKANHLKILELDKDSLDSFVRYLYHGTIKDCNLNECFKLLTIADKYNIRHLLTICQNVLQNKLSIRNAIDIFLLADLHNLKRLKARSVECVIESIEAIVLTKAWRMTNNASFFKCVYEGLVKIDNRVFTVGEILHSFKRTNHCLKVKFPIDAQQRIDRFHLMTVSPEPEDVNFIFRVSRHQASHSFNLSVCLYEYGDDNYYTSAQFSELEICIANAMTTSAKEVKSEMQINRWYEIASFWITKKQITIKLQISYDDIKYVRKNCAFIELVNDSSSADMTLESADGLFRQVHKSVLIARNLRAVVDQCDSKDHLKLCEVGALALNEFINFIYIVNNEELHVDYCAELLAVAHKYNLSAMKYECQAKLKTLINAETALELICLAVLNEAIFLQEWILDYVHLKKLVITEAKMWENYNNCDMIRKIIEHHLELKEMSMTTT